MESRYRDDLSTKKITSIQRNIRSSQRIKLHYSIFNESPVSTWPKLNIHPDFYQSELHYRLEKIIADITENQTIVNKKKIFHYTTLRNLASIVKDQYIYGNQLLRKRKENDATFLFDPNTLCDHDIRNGDNKVICFTPGLVDTFAYTTKSNFMIKPDCCCLTLDINHSSNKGAHNEFFKLSDFSVCWSCKFTFKDIQVSMSYRHDHILKISIYFNGKLAQISLAKHEMIFYGNIFYINRFCAVQFINIIDKITECDSTTSITGNRGIKNDLYEHLNNLDDTDLIKLLIIFSQNMTRYAEYNFNAALSLDDVKIKEILILGDKKIKYNFSNLNEAQYENALNLLSLSSYDELASYKEIVGNDNTIYNTSTNYQNSESLNVFGLTTFDSNLHVDNGNVDTTLRF